MNTKAHASSSSLSSSPSRHASPTRTAGMSTPKTARPRIPLGELPLSSFLSAANASASASPSSTSTGVSPILKPVATRHFAGSPTRVKRSTATATATSTPHTPPHHETHPVNVRPHHPHVATGLGLGLDSPNLHRPAAPLPASPTTCIAPATPPPSLLKRQHQSTSSSSPAPIAQPTATSSSSPQQPISNSNQSLPRRKRDRIDDATEHVLARERGQDPVWTSPSPHKNAAMAAAAAAAGTTSGSSRRYSSAHAHSHHHHRRMSSTGSAKAFALSPRFAAGKSLAPVAGGSAVDDDEEEDEEDELRETEGMVAVKPLRLNSPPTSISMGPPSSKSATPPRSAAAAAPALGEDVFGVTTSSPSGGLVVFCDDEAPVFPAVAAADKATTDKYAAEDGANRENDVSLLERFLGKTTDAAPKKHGKSKSKSPSLGMGGSSSPGPGALSPMKRKKGTGGRLSLVATGEAGKDVDGEEEEDDDDEDDDDEQEASG